MIPPRALAMGHERLRCFFGGSRTQFFGRRGHIEEESDGEVRLGYGKGGRSLTVSYQFGK